MNWIEQFYHLQNQWLGVYQNEVNDQHRRNAASVQTLWGGEPCRVLELGAGGGQNAAALADLGYHVTAVELVPSIAKTARQLAATRADQLSIVEGNFYQVDFAEPFDIVCYWDGFGIGEDADQKRLLERIAGWLRPNGIAVIEVFGTTYWRQAAGREMSFGDVHRRYTFDAAKQRMIDTWWTDTNEPVSQSLRCYASAELQTVVQNSGLQIESTHSRGAWYPEEQKFVEDVSVDEAMSYLAKLRRANGD